MLRVRGVDLHYGASRALRGVDLEAPIGDVTWVLGRNGGGKTSLLRAIVGQHKISRGYIMWNDADITNLPPRRRASSGIAYVPQGREIFSLLTVARALVMRPKLLVLDEPTEGIQPSIIKDIEAVIRLLRGRGTMGILLVEQYFDFARRLADRFVLMDRGEIVVHGSADKLDQDDVRAHLTV